MQHLPVLLALLVVVLVPYCARQQLELNTLKGTLRQSPGNINVNQLDVVENDPPQFATRNIQP